MDRCIIWDTPATYAQDTGDFARVESARAAGKYRVTGSAINAVKNLPVEQKKLLTSWLIQQRRAGVAIPEVSTFTLNEIKSRRPLSFSDKVEAVLLFFAEHLPRIGQFLLVAPGDPKALHNRLVAHAECESEGELADLVKLMVASGLLSMDGSHTQFRLAPAGWERLDTMLRQRGDSARAFVAMWFHDSMHEAYENGLYKAIYDSGYDPVRVDSDHHHLNKVDDEIIAEIRRARFLVADFTCEAAQQVRGNVYFEAGFAMGLNIPIIWTCKEICIGDLQFDTRQYPHIAWKDSADLYQKLQARIGALIGDGPKLRT